jgi:hypothetical protein
MQHRQLLLYVSVLLASTLHRPGLTSYLELLSSSAAMERSCELLLLALLVAAMAASLPLALAYDPSPLQDFCVADAASDGTRVSSSDHACSM